MAPTPLADVAARRPRLVLLALAAAVAFSFQGSRGLYETTEGRYAESALEMVQGRGWLEPTLSGRPHWTKPPLAYWAIAAGIEVAGPNGWGARLSNALVFCATVLAVAGIGATLFDGATGLVAGLVYLSSIFPAAAATVVSTDTLVAFWEILAVLLYVRAWRAGDARRARWLVRAMWLVWGLAFLTKGPPAVLPLLALAALSRLADRPPRLLDPVGLAAFALAGLSWYGWIVARHAGLLGYLVGDEVVGRALSNEFGRNPQWWKPFAIYLPVLLAGQGAWLAFGARLPWRHGLASSRGIWERIRRGDAPSLLLLWLLLPLAVFFLATSRLPLYVLPLYAPVAVAVARALVREGGTGAVRRALAVALPSVAVLVALKGAAAHALPPSDKDMAALHAAARAAGGPDAEVRAFGDERLYGLQFYLGGTLPRVSSTGREPWADERVGETVARLRGGLAAPQVLVAAAGADVELERALAAGGVRYRRVRAGSRALFVVRPEPRTAAAGAEVRP